MPIKLDRVQLARDLQEMHAKLAQASEGIRRLQPVSVGASPRDLVFQEDSTALYHYRGTPSPANRVPLLVVYSLVNRPYILDLKPERSLIGALRDGGSEVYLLDWGQPSPADRFLSLDDYISGYLHRAVREICKRHGVSQVALLGVCQGGSFAICYAALYPRNVRSLISLVAPVDFHAGNSTLRHLAKHVDFDRMVSTRGNVSAELLNSVFVSLKPFRLLSQRYVEMLDLAGDDQALTDFLRMEQWMYDSPNQAGEAFRQFAKDFYQDNGLVRGKIRLDERPVDLRRLTMPICNVYASADHLVPPESALALGEHVASADYQALEFPGGHLGVFISGRAQKSLFPALSAWLRARD